MNPVDLTLQECISTIAQLQARIIYLAIENAGLKAALEAVKKESEKKDA